MAESRVLYLRHLGLQPYAETLEAMRTFTELRGSETPDELWVLEHPPVFTQGQAGKPEHLLAPGDIPVVQVDRGGQVTYHGPGQLVVYVLLDLHRLGIGVRALVDVIEQSLVAVLAGQGIESHARPDAPGVYVGPAKIAALGLRVRKGRSYHGLSFNLSLDLSPFQRINPCGYQGMPVTRLADLLPDWSDVKEPLVRDALLRELAGRLGYTAEQVHTVVSDQLP